MTPISRRLLALLLSAPAVLSAQQPVVVADGSAPRPITLDEAESLAQRNAPALVQARGSLRSNAAQVRRSYAAFLPTLSVSAGTGRASGVSEVAGELVPRRGDPWSFNNGVSASLELFDGGQRFAELDRTKATVDAAEAGEIAQRFDVALNVQQQYYVVLAQREAEAAARQQLEQAEAQLAAATARLRAGTATKSDSLRTAIQVGNAQLAVLQAQTNINNANASLTRLVGTSYPVTAASSVDEPTAAPEALDSLALARLAADAPAVREAQANFTAARAGVRSAKTAYLPSLSMSYTYRSSQSAEGFETGNLWLLTGQNPVNKSLSFNLSYPVFNGLQRETSVIQAEVQERNAEAALRDAQLAAQQSLAQAVGTLRLAQERIRIQQQSIAAGEEDLRVQTERYQLGAATLLDVLTSQTTLNQARVALIQARFDARIARAQLEALVGRDL